MPKPRPPKLQRETTRHGTTVWYLRIDRGKRIRIKGEFGTPEFNEAYHAALLGQPRVTKQSRRYSNTLAWLVEEYRKKDAWRSLSLATRRQRENILRQVLETAGGEPYADITARHIEEGKDRRIDTPFQARHFLDTMRGAFEWAESNGYVKVNPASKVAYPTLKSGEGFPAWTDDDVAAYEKRWPLVTRQRVWFAVLRYTGLRRGDAVRLGRQHVKHGVASIKTQKSGGEIEVHIPILPQLREALDAGPTGEMTFICGANGKPMTKESFGNAFSDACRQAGVMKSAHGVRKIDATVAAENGATLHQLNAMFGWTGSKMASHYTQNADRKRLAQDAFSKLVNKPATSIPAPTPKVREPSSKR